MKVTVNGIELDLPAGTSAIDAVFSAGHDVPYFCSQEYMSPIGACRMCLARVGAPRRNPDGSWILDEATGEPQVFWFPNPMATCTTTVMEGMHIDTVSEAIQAAQGNMVEQTLINHPLDCPTCDKGGACELQDRSYEYGDGLSRFEFTKRHSEKHHELSNLITLDRERCIHCKRCVRYFAEVPGDEVLDFIDRGGHTYIGTKEDQLPGNFTGNVTDICPVGALLDATSRFRGRNWEYDHIRSTTPNDASGSAIVIDARTGRIERIRAALNPDINQIWIDDGTRFGHEYTDPEGRIRAPMLRRDGELVEVTWREATDFIAGRLGQFSKGETGVLLRADATLEEGVAARSLAEHLGTPHLDHQPRPAASVIPAAKPATFTELATADHVLVFGDPTEEVPIVELRIRDALKGVPPVELMEHGVPIADLRLKEHAPLDHSRLSVCAPYRVNLMRIAGTSIMHAAGSEAELIGQLARLAAGRDEDASPEAGRIVASLRAAGNKVIVAGGMVLADPEAATQLATLARATGAKVMLMGPAANSFGLELTGVMPLDGGRDYAGMLDGGLRALIVSQLDPAASAAAADALSRMELVVAHATLHNATTAIADVVLPAVSGFEKNGTFVNVEGRALPVRAAPVDSGGAEDFCGLVKRLGESLSTRLDGRSLRSAHRVLKARTGEDLTGLDDAGVILATRRHKARKPSAPPVSTGGNGSLRVLFVPSMRRHEYVAHNPHLLAEHGYTPLRVSAADAASLQVTNGDFVTIEVNGTSRRAEVFVSESAQDGTLLLPVLPEQPSGLGAADRESLVRERQALEVV